MDKQALAMRQVKGQEIAHLEGAVRRLSDDVYHVKSQSGHGEYTVHHAPVICNAMEHRRQLLE